MSRNSSENLYNPGDDNVPGGTYQEVGPRGGKVEDGRTATIRSGNRLPPTSKSGNKWERQ